MPELSFITKSSHVVGYCQDRGSSGWPWPRVFGHIVTLSQSLHSRHGPVSFVSEKEEVAFFVCVRSSPAAAITEASRTIVVARTMTAEVATALSMSTH